MNRREAALSLGALVLAAVFWMGQCNAGKSGELNRKATEAIEQARFHKKAAQLWKDSANAERKRGDSLRLNLTKTDAIVRDRTQKYAGAREAYRKLRDSIQDAPPIVIAADSALAQADSTIKAHEVKDAIQDSLIASQDRRIGFLENALSSKEQQVQALNRRVATDAKRITRARYQGSLIGVGMAAFAVITVISAR